MWWAILSFQLRKINISTVAFLSFHVWKSVEDGDLSFGTPGLVRGPSDRNLWLIYPRPPPLLSPQPLPRAACVPLSPRAVPSQPRLDFSGSQSILSPFFHEVGPHLLLLDLPLIVHFISWTLEFLISFKYVCLVSWFHCSVDDWNRMWGDNVRFVLILFSTSSYI